MISVWALGGSHNAYQTPSLQISPPQGTPRHTLHPAHATCQGPLTARPWAIPPGVWGPPRSGTPAPPLHQPGPPPPGQPRLQAPQVGLAEKGSGGCGEKSSAPTIPACPGPLPAHPSLLPPGPRGKLPKPLAKQPRLCASSAPRCCFVSHGPTAVTRLPARVQCPPHSSVRTETRSATGPLCPQLPAGSTPRHTHTPKRRGGAGPEPLGNWGSSASLTEHEQIEVPLGNPGLVLSPAGIEARVALLDPGKVEGLGSIQEAVATHGGDLSRRGPRELGGGWSGHPLAPNSSEETEAQGAGW